MEKDKKDLWKYLLKSDTINVIVGVVLLISLVFVYRNPYNKAAILTACIAGGLINLMNGLKTMKDPKRKTTGMMFLMLGAMLVILGFIITQYVMK